MKLEEIRKKIDRIDDAIFDCLVERFRLSVIAGIAKRQLGRTTRDKEREEQILKRLSHKAKTMDINDSFVADVFLRILDQSNRIQESHAGKSHSQTVTITPPAQTSQYVIGSGLLAHLHTVEVCNTPSYDRFLLVSDETVYRHFGTAVSESLMKLGVPVVSSVIAPGEQSKRFETITGCVRPFFEKGLSRRSCVIALGGGMICDLGGFIASILLRGIDCIYLPTTLLSQVDAAIGGKTGVDYWLDPRHMYKNMIGTIRQPTAVISDTDTLKTLPPAEITNGLGEMVKYWIGWGRPTQQELITCKNMMPDSTSRRRHSLWRRMAGVAGWSETQAMTPRMVEESDSSLDIQQIISACQDIKLDIIRQDPYETKGIRQQLNLGHTIGHAVESAAQGTCSHGQAVAIGCIAAARISVAMGMLDKSECDTIEKTITSLGLPTKAGSMPVERILEYMRLDKKGGTFVLIRSIGKLETQCFVPEEIVRDTVTYITN